MWRRVFWALLTLLLLVGSAAFVVAWQTVRRWDAEVTERFRSHRWRFASKIYSDTYLLYPGLDIQASALAERLAELGYEATQSMPDRAGTYWRTAEAWYIFVRPTSAAEDRGRLVQLQLEGSTIRELADGTSGEPLATVELDPALITGLYEGEWQDRKLVTLDDVPPLLVWAILDTEDQRFFQHHGIDWYGIARAIYVNLRTGRVVQGGSTLTQQLMKNFFLQDERTLRRKLHEAAMALIVERRFSKQEILEHYLNEIYLGQRGAQAIHGVYEAAQFYFGKTPAQLTLGEMAMIAGLIRGPGYYSPFRNLERARKRRDYVLERMFQAGHIDEGTLERARQEPLMVLPVRSRGKDAPYFADFVRQQLVSLYPAELLATEGLRIYTTLDMHLQRLAEEAVERGLERLEQRYPRLRADNEEQRVQACLLAIEPHTGFVRAMAGGRDYRTSQFNRCTQALRQPGSVFKPIVYAAVLEATRDSPAPILPTTRVEDEPFVWEYDGRAWSPANYGNRYLGLVTVREALEQSLNAATARLAHQVGIQPILDLAEDLGLRSFLPRVPSVILGAGEVTPFEVAQAFATLANGGIRPEPLAIRRVLDRSGVALERKSIELQSVLPADTAFLVTHMLRGVLDRGTARAARSWGFRLPAAGKTGTTNDYKDAWFVGYTPTLLTVVWVGFDAERELGLSGAQAALPLWVDFMRRATAGQPPLDFEPPPGVQVVRIDPLSGGLATPACPEVLDEAFYTGLAPTEPCPLHAEPPSPDAF